MYPSINGWTKERMKAQIRLKNKGYMATKNTPPGSGGCVYEAPDGNRCAAGCFFPDGHPALKDENYIGVAVTRHPDLESVLPLGLENGMTGSGMSWAHDSGMKETDEDLVAEWKDPITIAGWLNVYGGRSSFYPTRFQADRAADPDRTACVFVSGTEDVCP